MNPLRKVFRLDAEGNPTEIAFAELRKGDRFMLDGGEGDHERGTRVHVAACDPYDYEGTLAVNINVGE